MSDVISQVVLTSRLIKKEEEIAMAHKGRLCDGRGGGMSDFFPLEQTNDPTEQGENTLTCEQWDTEKWGRDILWE